MQNSISMAFLPVEIFGSPSTVRLKSSVDFGLLFESSVCSRRWRWSSIFVLVTCEPCSSSLCWFTLFYTNCRSCKSYSRNWLSYKYSQVSCPRLKAVYPTLLIIYYIYYIFPSTYTFPINHSDSLALLARNFSSLYEISPLFYFLKNGA